MTNPLLEVVKILLFREAANQQFILQSDSS